MSDQVNPPSVEEREAQESGLLLSVDPLEPSVPLRARADDDAADTDAGGDTDASDTDASDTDASDDSDDAADAMDIVGDNADGTDAGARDTDGTDAARDADGKDV